MRIIDIRVHALAILNLKFFTAQPLFKIQTKEMIVGSLYYKLSRHSRLVSTQSLICVPSTRWQAKILSVFLFEDERSSGIKVLLAV